MAKNFFTHLGLIVLEKTQSQNGGGGGGGGGGRDMATVIFL